MVTWSYHDVPHLNRHFSTPPGSCTSMNDADDSSAAAAEGASPAVGCAPASLPAASPSPLLSQSLLLLLLLWLRESEEKRVDREVPAGKKVGGSCWHRTLVSYTPAGK